MLIGDTYLTQPYEDRLGQKIKHTHMGQPTWAEPEFGRTCRECAFWGKDKFDRFEGGELKPKRCYFNIPNKSDAAVPHDAYACGYFKASENPPAIEPAPPPPSLQTPRPRTSR